MLLPGLWVSRTAALPLQVHHALKLAVWINSIERTRFSPPYMDKVGGGVVSL